MSETKVEKEVKKKPGRPKGSPKVGGRKKGTPNKSSRNLLERLDRARFDPVTEYIRLYEAVIDPDKKLAMLTYLFAHIFPRLKEIELPLDEPAQKVIPTPTNVKELIRIASSSDK